MASRGKPAEIGLDELERLCAMQATDEEIASWFKCTTRTIERKRIDPVFAEVMERGKAKGRLTVRRAQLKMLEQGNATMAIWLGKQYLGQTDEIRHAVNVSTQLQIVIPRGLEPQPAVASVAGHLSDTGEQDVEIAREDYENADDE